MMVIDISPSSLSLGLVGDFFQPFLMYADS